MVSPQTSLSRIKDPNRYLGRCEASEFDDFDGHIEHLPDGTTITNTALTATRIRGDYRVGREGGEARFRDRSEGSRYVRNRNHPVEIAERSRSFGLFIFSFRARVEISIGEFESAYDLLVVLEDLEYEFDDIETTGYSEGRVFLLKEMLTEVIQKKSSYATYIAGLL